MRIQNKNTKTRAIQLHYNSKGDPYFTWNKNRFYLNEFTNIHNKMWVSDAFRDIDVLDEKGNTTKVKDYDAYHNMSYSNGLLIKLCDQEYVKVYYFTGK